MANETKRNEHMRRMCQRLALNAKFLSSAECKPGYLGCSLAHLRALSTAREKSEYPVLVLENDCDVTNRFKAQIEIPDQTDIMYLGNSSCGCVPEYNHRGVRGCALIRSLNNSDDICVVENMTATHAILYVTPEAIDAAIDSIVRSVARSIPLDIGYVLDLQSTFNVFTFRLPFFYQSAKLQSEHLADVMQRMTLNEILPVKRPEGESFSFIETIGARTQKATMTLKKSSDGRRYWGAKVQAL